MSRLHEGRNFPDGADSDPARNSGENGAPCGGPNGWLDDMDARAISKSCSAPRFGAIAAAQPAGPVLSLRFCAAPSPRPPVRESRHTRSASPSSIRGPLPRGSPLRRGRRGPIGVPTALYAPSSGSARVRGTPVAAMPFRGEAASRRVVRPAIALQPLPGVHQDAVIAEPSARAAGADMADGGGRRRGRVSGKTDRPQRGGMPRTRYGQNSRTNAPFNAAAHTPQRACFGGAAPTRPRHIFCSMGGIQALGRIIRRRLRTRRPTPRGAACQN